LRKKVVYKRKTVVYTAESQYILIIILVQVSSCYCIKGPKQKDDNI